MVRNLIDEVKQRIKGDQEVQVKIAKLFCFRNIVTIQRWVAKNDQRLTQPFVLDVIREHFGFAEDMELTEPASEEQKLPV